MMVFFVAVLSASLLFQMFYIVPFIQSQEVKYAADHQNEVSNNVARELDLSLNELLKTLEKISKHVTIRNMDVNNQTEILLQYAEVYFNVNTLFVMNETGWFVSGTTFVPSIYQTKSYSYNEYFIVPFEQGEVYFSSPKSYLNNTLVSCSISVPIESDTGERVGVLLGTMWLNDLIHNVANYPLSEGTIAYLVEPQGIVVAHSEIDLFALEEGPLSLNYSTQPLVQFFMNGETKVFFEHVHDNVSYISTSIFVEANSWGVVVETPKNTILAESFKLTQNLWMFNIAFFGIALTVSLVFTRQSARVRKRAEEAIVNLARFPSENPHPVLRFAKEGVILYTNESAKSLLTEWNREVGQSAPDLWSQKASNSFASDSSLRFEVEHLNRIFSFEMFPVTDAGYVNAYGRDITERKKAENALKKSEESYRMLYAERVKELRCLYGIFQLLDKSSISLEEIFQGIIDLIPPAFQYPKRTCARITIDEQTFKTDNFKETRWKQSAVIKLSGKNIGSVEVYYLEERPESHEEPFLKEEIDLINGISELLGRSIERKQIEKEMIIKDTAIESSINGVVLVDLEGKITYVNPVFLKLWGYTKSEILGKPAIKFWQIEEKAKATMESIREEGGWIGELVARRKDESTFDVELSGNMVKNEAGNPICMMISFIDISERKKAEEKIEETMLELARSNSELEQFAYVASHDLQEPLRMVTSYVQLLARRYEGRLDSDADEFIAFAVSGSKRMQRLINDLLMYSRVGTRGKSLEPINSESAFNQSLTNLKMKIKENEALVTHDPLPTVFADESQLVQLLQNLIDNGVKFRSEKPPHIHVSAMKKGSEWVFSVRDNGMGIDPQYHERIFEVFQRLHTGEEYSGTGIGLAICKKVVDRHGGRMWVESQSGEGSTFYFTLQAPRVDGVGSKNEDVPNLDDFAEDSSSSKTEVRKT